MKEPDYIDKLKEFELRAYEAWNKVLTQINNVSDARAYTFHLIAIAVRSFKIYFILKEKYLDTQEWYIKIYQSDYKQPWPTPAERIINFRQELN